MGEGVGGERHPALPDFPGTAPRMSCRSRRLRPSKRVKFTYRFPWRTCRATIQETGGTRLYQGHRVSSEWQSAHERSRISSTLGCGGEAEGSDGGRGDACTDHGFSGLPSRMMASVETVPVGDRRRTRTEFPLPDSST